ncbi:tyrosine-type recombinase/integrase [Ihubacter sp. mB4P-1]|uniref:site-specific integrase n=1 Tax=Ihubacter sp. mB4P-1 TaxID=3242370 RepID=UPI003C7B0CA6
MPAYKNPNGTWYVSFYYRDMNGKNIKKKKTGFSTKKEALKWERNFIETKSGNVNISFKAFVDLYTQDVKPRIKHTTWLTKERIIQLKIIPYFEEKIVSDITASDIVKWQNLMMNYRDNKGKGYAQTYLRTINNQLSAIFNHAVRLYNLPENPVRKAGSMGGEKTKEMQVWTKSEYLRFSQAIKDNPDSFYAFEILYWCGIRIGELQALTGADFDFEKKVLNINKSYQRLEKKDFITPPKTEKSNRMIALPDFLCDEMKKYLRRKRRTNSKKRIFTMSRNFLHTEMSRGAQAAGVKRIRIHDLRHSHVSLLISMGFTPVDIANRMGHESIDITLHYAHMFPSRQFEMADRLNTEFSKIEDNI